MIVRLWELVTFVVVLLFSVIFLLGGQPIEGVAFAALACFWLVTRARVPERLGAHYVRRQAAFEMAKIGALWLVFLAVVAAILVATISHWNRDPEGPVLFFALTGVVILLKREIEHRIDRYDDLAAGGDAEIAVEGKLAALREFEVEHNWLRPDGYGNVDHIAHRLADDEWFVVETKSGRYRPDHARQAIGCAMALKNARGLRWVTPIVCVGKAPEQVREYRLNRSRVWVVRIDHLADWLPTAPSTRRY